LNVRVVQFAPGFRQRTLQDLAPSLRAAVHFPLDYAALALYVRQRGIRILHGTDRPRDIAYTLGIGKLTGAKSIVHVHVKWSEAYSKPAKWGVRNADAVFAISEYVAGTVVAMGTPRERVHTVLNCVDVTRWDPAIDGSGVRAEYSIPRDAPLITSVSRLFSWKGQRELVQAFARVRESAPNAWLMIVGADQPHIDGGSFTAELKRLASELGIADRVVFTGLRTDIPQVMAASDIFAMPSFEEPFGLVFLEAMAMQKPVVALDNGGTPEVVEHGKAGLLSAPYDIPGLAANLLRLLADPAERERMGHYGRERVVSYFNTRRMAQDAGNAYERILGLR
jgi:glycosyltransferase involved in cell wall biosynthesis